MTATEIYKTILASITQVRNVRASMNTQLTKTSKPLCVANDELLDEMARNSAQALVGAYAEEAEDEQHAAWNRGEQPAPTLFGDVTGFLSKEEVATRAAIALNAPVSAPLVITSIEQLMSDQTYKTWVPTMADGQIIGEPIARQLADTPWPSCAATPNNCTCGELDRVDRPCTPMPIPAPVYTSAVATTTPAAHRCPMCGSDGFCQSTAAADATYLDGWRRGVTDTLDKLWAAGASGVELTPVKITELLNILIQHPPEPK